MLVGLASLAITQPELDLLGRNPEFFVAGRYTTSQIVLLALIVAFVPSMVLVIVYELGRLTRPRVADVVHSVLLAALGALFGNVLLRGLGHDATAAALVVTLAGAVGVVALGRTRAGRLLLSYLAVANVVFLAAFLFASPASDLLTREEDTDALGQVWVPEPPGPVVVIVLDELPLATIVRPDGSINEERFPNFARLAARTTWFRNASSLANHTEHAVPEIATGSVVDESLLPTSTAFPHNLLALLGTGMAVERYEPVTDLCPRSVCEPQASQSLRRAFEDAFVVYEHRVLPAALRDDLPRIDQSWGEFDNVATAASSPASGDGSQTTDLLRQWHSAGNTEREAATQARRLIERAQTVGTPGLHFIHVVLPHVPWHITPWSTRVMPPFPPLTDADPYAPGGMGSLYRYQLHSMQTGAADVGLGEVLDRLEESGEWDDATLLVTADHGTSTIPPSVGRERKGDNEEEIFRVPLFLKTPHQDTSSVVDDVAMSIDILPTLIDVLDIETDWEMDGHSLLDGSLRTVDPIVTTSVEGLFEVVARHAADFPLGWDWDALAAIGDRAALVGRPLDELEQGEPSRLSWELANEAAFKKVPNEKGEAPQLVSGVVRGGTQHPSFVIAVNGTIAGVGGGYVRDDDGWTFYSLLGPHLLPRDNKVTAYEVTGPTNAPVLHRIS